MAGLGDGEFGGGVQPVGGAGELVAPSRAGTAKDGRGASPEFCGGGEIGSGCC